METKKCYKCGKIKPLNEFNKSKDTKDGYEGQCKQCRKESRKKHILVCEVCGKEYKTTNKKSKYCSRDCSIKGRTKTEEQFINEMMIKHPNIEILGEYKGTHCKIKVKCKIDKHEWETEPNNLLQGIGCPKCAIRDNTLNQTKTHEEFMNELEEKNSHFNNIEILGEYIKNNIKIKCRCKIDSYEWEATPTNLLNGTGCPECKRRRFIGENNPRYNPNLTQEDREKDRKCNPDYTKFIKEVLKRDNYTCQVTGKRGGDLVVHHLYSYNKYPCLRTVIDNGITISKEIHKEFHEIYGYGDNTEEQFIDFLVNRYLGAVI